MINHARTLLLNQSRKQTHYSDVGYEYIPPNFQPVMLSPSLTAVRQILFGAKPDNYFRNFRCNELMSYIHSTELAEFAYKFDPRVTYWPKLSKPYFEPATKRILITQTYGAPRRLVAAGDLFAITTTGNALNQYVVTLRNVLVDAVEKLQFEVKYLGRRSAVLNVIVDNIESPPTITLPETNLNLRLNTGALDAVYPKTISSSNNIVTVEMYSPTPQNAFSANTEELPTQPTIALGAIEAQWLIETRVHPASIITTGFTSLETIGEPAVIDLFGLENKQPYITFKNLWFDHPLPAYKLSGAVLALIYRTEEMRGKNGI